MKSAEPHNEPDEHNDPLSKLLAQSPPHRASIGFVDNVVHALKSTGGTTSKPPASRPTRWLHLIAPTAAAAALLLTSIFSLTRMPDADTPASHVASPSQPTSQPSTHDESRVVNLDELDLNGSITEQLLGLDEEQYLSSHVEFDRLVTFLDPMDILDEQGFVYFY